MIASTRHTVDPADGSAFLADASHLLSVFTGSAGCLRGRLGRAVDDPAEWVMLTEWTSIGAYRRALGSLSVQAAMEPTMGSVHDEPSAFEVLYADGDVPATYRASDRAGDELAAPPDQPIG